MGIWSLVSWPGIEPRPFALEAQCLKPPEVLNLLVSFGLRQQANGEWDCEIR